MPAATYRIKAPDGNTYQIDGPEGATDDQIRAAVLGQHPEAANAGKPQSKVSEADQKMIDDYRVGSGTDQFFAGAGKAVTDLYQGGKQLFGRGDQAKLQKDIDERKKLDEPLMDTGAGIAGNLAGNLAATAIPGTALARGVMALPKVGAAINAVTSAAPVLSGMAAGAGTGAATGALEPVATGESRGKNVAVGAGIGTLGGLIPGLLAKPVGGAKLSAEAQMLADEGVRLTPGQAMGGVYKGIEEKATSIPLLGAVIKRAQTRGIEDFNRAGFNRALAPIGEKVGPDFNIGREGVAAVEAKIGAAYDKALDNIKIVNLDNTFGDEVGKVIGMTAELGEGPAKQFAAILKNRVLDKTTEAGTMSAETMKEVESTLGMLARKWSGSQDQAQRGLGDAIREVQSSLRGAVERSSGPEALAELKAANTAWANFVRIQDAAGRIGAKDGLFTPSQLTSAVRGQDKSVRKGAFARGDALLQDLSEAGKNVISQEVPNSGTVDRLLNFAAPFGLPFMEPHTLAAAGAAGLAYTNLGGKITLKMLTERPELMRELAEIMRRGSPAGGVASGLLAPSLAGP